MQAKWQASAAIQRLHAGSGVQPLTFIIAFLSVRLPPYMHTVTIILVLVLTVVLCGFIARMRWAKLPLPLIQIAGGSLLALFGLQLPLDPDIFPAVYPAATVPGRLAHPQGRIFSDARAILMLAIGLVLFTVVGMGFFIDWLIPTVPLAVAFALGRSCRRPTRWRSRPLRLATRYRRA